MGLSCTDGVVLVGGLNPCCLTSLHTGYFLNNSAPFDRDVKRLSLSKMLEDGSNRQTFAVDRHAGVVGLSSCSLMASMWPPHGS